MQRIHTPAFDRMELKQRMRHTAMVLHQFMPSAYTEAVKVIEQLIPELRRTMIGMDMLPLMLLPDYVEVYGLDDYHISVRAIEQITQLVSCEFAVRPFLIRYTDAMLAQMLKWTDHDSYAVRRLASEGSRSRLPWAMAVPALKKDPQLILPILEKLNNDPSEWVRRSVANSLNDIARDHPDVVLQIARDWQGISAETDAIIKHGSRTLLKRGHTEILTYFGLDATQVTLTNLRIITPKVTIGGDLDIRFTVRNERNVAQKIRLEYALFYLMKNGKLSKKVFKISERIYQPGETCTIDRRHRFVVITTRTYYCGTHEVSVIVNGQEKARGSFELCPA